LNILFAVQAFKKKEFWPKPK